jgi:hypothetical protein
VDAGQTLTCGYGFRSTGRTLRADLRIRRLGVRIPPSAPKLEPFLGIIQLTVWIIWPDFGRVSFPGGIVQPVGVAVHVPG